MNPNEGFNKITLYNLSLHQSVESHSYQTNCVHKLDEINIRSKPVCVLALSADGGGVVGWYRPPKLARLNRERLGHLFQMRSKITSHHFHLGLNELAVNTPHNSTLTFAQL